MDIFNDVMQRSLPTIFIVLLNGLLLWCVWSLRKVFVRHEDCEVCRVDIQIFEQRFERQANTYKKLAQRMSTVPTTNALHAIHLEMAQLRGEQARMAADIQGIHGILERIEQPLILLMQQHLKV